MQASGAGCIYLVPAITDACVHRIVCIAAILRGDSFNGRCSVGRYAVVDGARCSVVMAAIFGPGGKQQIP